MATKTITWSDGTTAVLTYGGQGSGPITVQSEPNNHYEARSAQIVVKTTDGSNIQRTVTISQAAKVRTDISNAVVTATNQTYSGTAKTPTPTVTLNDVTIPSLGYDVAYSNNTNAGTATITVTGKGDYTGTATGTFTIAKANPTYTAPTARTGLTYSGGSQYLVTAGSTSHGTIQYSSNGTTWSTTRPSSTNAGSYTTYWRLVGDSNHNDVTSTSLSTTIAKASRTLSFADSYVVLDTSSNITKTATPSAGSGDGAITYSISSTTYATINSSSGKVTSKTSDGSAIVTATIAEGTNYLSATASYNLYVFATTHNFAYTGTVQNVTLPPGSYKLQCWGAQGGSNAAYASYGITAKAGGKGGYSEGVLTIDEQKTIYAFVGGQGASSGDGGWNGGGGGPGSVEKTYVSGTVLSSSRMGCGGGATDFSLVTSSMLYSNYRTDRSAASLLARMIVAGGGSGGAMCYKKVTSTTQREETLNWAFGTYGYPLSNMTTYSASNGNMSWTSAANASLGGVYVYIDLSSYTFPVTVELNVSSVGGNGYLYLAKSTDRISSQYSSEIVYTNNRGTGAKTITLTDSTHPILFYYCNDNKPGISVTGTKRTWTETSYTETNESQVGFAGGGTTGAGYVDAAKGKQNAAGTLAGFGYGANGKSSDSNLQGIQSGSGGGGWYGGGMNNASENTIYVHYSGGGSGFVNTSASAGNRPSGYTGLQLDSGSTTAGSSSFPAPGGGNETGHSGNGYARITRLS